MKPTLPILCIASLLISCSPVQNNKLLNHVDLLIGTGPATTIAARSNEGDHVDHGQTIPAVTAPFGMTQWTPQTRASEKKCLAPFYAEDTLLQGIRGTHWTSGSCVQDYGSFTFMPVSGDFKHLPDQRKTKYHFGTKKPSPAFTELRAPDYQTVTEISSTKRCGVFRMQWLTNDSPAIVFDVNSDEGQGFIRIDAEKREIVASNPVHRIYNGWGKPAGFSGHMVAQFNCDVESFGTYAGETRFNGINEQENQPLIGGYVKLKIKPGQKVVMKIGTSFTSIDQARKNLESEIPQWDFDKTLARLEESWEKLLGTIQVELDDNNQLTQFYTAMYHSLVHPRLFSDSDGSYVGFADDPSIHKAEGFEYYTDFSAWDTYRAQMPLLSIIAPRQYKDMVHSLVMMASQGGWLPIFPMWNSYTSAMIGDHCAAIIGDAYLKGFDVDMETAWPYLRKNAFESPDDINEYIDGKGRRALQSYLQYGYIPVEDEVNHAFHKREQVSRTLEYAYDDWVLAQVAKKMGHTADFDLLIERSRNYINVFDEEQGWVNGRHADGSFASDFDPSRGMYFITEGTPMHYTWYVPHDIPGLIDLMGGQYGFLSKLSDLIDNKLYWHGNEPSHQIPYLFNYAGRWDLTQKTVKNLLVTEYGTGPGGLSGNDDAGQMSAWYVCSAIGFYPVCPGSNEYQVSSPVFDRVSLHLDPEFYPGGTFILETKNKNESGIFNILKYNGLSVEPVITHEMLKNGGTLVFDNQP